MRQHLRQHESIRGMGRDLPPPFDYVVIYFIQKGMTEKNAEYFFQHHDRKNWCDDSGRKIKNWKTVACDWIWERQHFKRDI